MFESDIFILKSYIKLFVSRLESIVFFHPSIIEVEIRILFYK